MNQSSTLHMVWAAAWVVIAMAATSTWASIQGAQARDADVDDEPTHYGAAVTEAVLNGSSYVGVGSTVVALTGGGGTLGVDFRGSTIQILDGMNDSGSIATVSMAWRTRTTLEKDGPSFVPRVAGSDGDLHYADANHALAPEAYNMLSDVVNLTGVVGPYVLESDYDQSVIVYDPGETENSLAAEGWMYLGWLETDGSAGDLAGLDEWVYAVDGNSSAGANAVTNYQGGWLAFVTSQGGGPLDLNDYLGSWGVDTANDKVWAVIDHASVYGAVPEPATMSVLTIVGLVMIPRRRR